MKTFLKKIGKGLAMFATCIVSTATIGLLGEVEPPECLK